jgi:hypothetical protein
MNTLKKFWPTILTVLAGGATFLSPSVQAFASSHAQYSAAILTAWGVILHYMTPPNK